MPETATKRKPLPQHWYRIYLDECPVCGRGTTTRERVYGKPPKDPQDRYEYVVYACGHHFA